MFAARPPASGRRMRGSGARRIAARSLKQEIAVALVLKVIALAALYFAFFDEPHRIVVRSGEAAAYLFQGSSASRE
jgi:hypothetical protein